MPQRKAADVRPEGMKKAAQNATRERLDSDRVAQRAYELWVGRGSPIGSPEVDWFRAESELANSPTGLAAESHLSATG